MRERPLATARRSSRSPAAADVARSLPCNLHAVNAILYDRHRGSRTGHHHHNLLDAAREGVLTEPGLPSKAYKLPAGTIARLAIDRWARRSPTAVVDDAVG